MKSPVVARQLPASPAPFRKARACALALLVIGVPVRQTSAQASERRPLPLPASQAKQPVPNPCARYGEGYVQVQGSDACVRIGGRLRIDVGRGLRSDARPAQGLLFGEAGPSLYPDEFEGVNRAHIRVQGSRLEPSPITR